MIVRPRGSDVCLISQHDHARAAGAIARSWKGIESLPAPPEAAREEILFAVDNHDVGWCRSDASPKWDEMTRLPCSFFGVTADEAVKIWAEGVDACASFHPVSGCLVSLHFAALAAGGRRGAPQEVSRLLTGFIRAEAERREKLDALVGPEARGAIEGGAALLRACDTLSLLACRAPEITPPDAAVHPLAQGGLKVKAAGANDLEISPWPFSMGSLDLRMPGWIIPGVRFENERALTEALPLAEPVVFSSVLTRLSESGSDGAARNEARES